MQISPQRITEIVVNLEVAVVNYLFRNMVKQIEIKEANNSFRERIISLLQAEKLPTDDLPGQLDNFFIAVDQGLVIGAIGLEQYKHCGLLRSLVVNPSYRNQNIAGELIANLEQKAMASGIECIYLLTETAPKYFERKGYSKITRDEVPGELQESSEFNHVCPTSAIVMKKPLS